MAHERVRRSIAKALSWRFFATIVTATIVLILTGEASFAVTVGLLDTVVKLVVYFVHERIWLKIPFGIKKKRPEYEI